MYVCWEQSGIRYPWNVGRNKHLHFAFEIIRCASSCLVYINSLWAHTWNYLSSTQQCLSLF